MPLQTLSEKLRATEVIACSSKRAGGLMKLNWRARQIIEVAALVIASASAVCAQAPSPEQLVRETVHNELTPSNRSAKFMYLDHKQDGHGSRTHLSVETTQATASMLVAQDGKPLTPEQKQAEEAQLQRMLQPDEIKKREKADKEDTEHTDRIMKALPDAFLYTPDGTEPGTDSVGKAGSQLVRLRFRPNPDYQPPTHTEQVLSGMQGVLLIEPQAKRIARIDGKLIKEVGFGWGILGHLDKGGRFLVEQADVGRGEWEVTRMDLDFTGKILMFKSLNIKSTEVCSAFKPAPSNLTFAEGIELLKKHGSELAENHTPDHGPATN